jgi:DNA polymerase I-like protein with 3'-5' exonuclease and polymerase domains
VTRYIFDIECNGFLDTVTKLHSLVLLNLETGEMQSYAFPGASHDTDQLEAGLLRLRKADELIGHNVLAFDIPVLQKLAPWFEPEGKVTDTLVLSRLIHSDLKAEDAPRLATKSITPKLYGSHSLEAWGERLGLHKGNYEGGFEVWSQEMQDYCEQDVRVTKKLYDYLRPSEYSPKAIALEHDMMKLCADMEREGWPFDVRGGLELYSQLSARREAIKTELLTLFPPWDVVDRVVTYKRPNKTKGIKAGDVVTHMKTVYFNPSSRQHIAHCLKEKYNWSPKEFTENGQPRIDDEVLSSLVYPEAKALAEYFLIEKRIGQLAEGDNAWLKLERKGRIHGRYNPNGTVTGRCTHQQPNIAQVPSVKKSKAGVLKGLEGGYGYESRSLFKAPEGMVMVGADMSGLELRCLAHFMAFYDKGEYAKVVTEGDVHTTNMQAAGLATRDIAKRFCYSVLYGASAGKVAEVIGGTRKEGEQAIERFFKNLPALSQLKRAVGEAAKKGHILSLDGRKIPIRSPHAALNSLLQSTGAILCKTWFLTIREAIEAEGLVWGKDFYFLAHVHDEVQIAVKKGYEELVGKITIDSAQRVAERYKFRCPLAAEYKIGQSWAECH